MGWLSNFFRKAETVGGYRDFEREWYEREAREYTEALERAKEHGFRLLLDPMTMRYVDGFDRHAETEFMRYGWLAPSVFKLADAHPAFNVAGLYWRALSPTEIPEA